MTDESRVRASHTDRERTAGLLREAYVCGRLELAELRERAGAAYSARTLGDLRRLTEDLPPGPWLDPPPSGAARRTGQAPATAGRPFAPMLVMAVIWLLIAALARAPQVVVMPLVLLGVWALYAAAWRAPASMRPDVAQRRPAVGPPGRSADCRAGRSASGRRRPAGRGCPHSGVQRLRATQDQPRDPRRDGPACAGRLAAGHPARRDLPGTTQSHLTPASAEVSHEPPTG